MEKKEKKNASSLSRNESEKKWEEKNFNTRIIMKFKPTDYGKPLLKIIIILHCMQVCGSRDAMAYWVEMNERRWVIQITVRRTWEGLPKASEIVASCENFDSFPPHSSSTLRLIYSSSHSIHLDTHAHRPQNVGGCRWLVPTGSLSRICAAVRLLLFRDTHLFFQKP